MTRRRRPRMTTRAQRQAATAATANAKRELGARRLAELDDERAAGALGIGHASPPDELAARYLDALDDGDRADAALIKRITARAHGIRLTPESARAALDALEDARELEHELADPYWHEPPGLEP